MLNSVQPRVGFAADYEIKPEYEKHYKPIFENNFDKNEYIYKMQFGTEKKINYKENNESFAQAIKYQTDDIEGKIYFAYKKGDDTKNFPRVCFENKKGHKYFSENQILPYFLVPDKEKDNGRVHSSGIKKICKQLFYALKNNGVSYYINPFRGFAPGDTIEKAKRTKIKGNKKIREIRTNGVTTEQFTKAYDAIMGNDKEKYKNKVHSILISHVVPNIYPYISYVNCVFPIDKLVVIPYSSDKGTVERLKEEGINVVEPKNHNDINEIVLNEVDELKNKKHKLVIQDIGGYMSENMKALNNKKNVLGVVEDTAGGHHRYVEVDSPSSKCRPKMPVLSVAFGPTKPQENLIVGDSVVFALENSMRTQLINAMAGKSALVLGYGQVGQSAARALRGRFAYVSVYDKNPIMNMRARLEGYNTGNVKNLVKNADIIVGATGKQSMGPELIDNIKDGAYLCSGSSRDVEFDVETMKKNTIHKDDTMSVITRECVNKNNHCYTLLNEGFPINFKLGGIQDTALYFVFGELVYSMKKIADAHLSGHPLKKGLQANTEKELIPFANAFQESMYYKNLDYAA